MTGFVHGIIWGIINRNYYKLWGGGEKERDTDQDMGETEIT